MLKIAINGFGRMGRLYFRTLWGAEGIEIVRINEPAGDAKCSAHLLEFDSVHGKFMNNQIQVEGENIVLGGKTVQHSSESNIATTDWQDIDVLVDCSGKYRETHLFDPVFRTRRKKDSSFMPSKRRRYAQYCLWCES